MRELMEGFASVELQTIRTAGTVFNHGKIQLDPTSCGELALPRKTPGTLMAALVE